MPKKPIIYTKQDLINKLKEISAMGWIPNARRGNAGGGVSNHSSDFRSKKVRASFSNCDRDLIKKNYATNKATSNN